MEIGSMQRKRAGKGGGKNGYLHVLGEGRNEERRYCFRWYCVWLWLWWHAGCVGSEEEYDMIWVWFFPRFTKWIVLYMVVVFLNPSQPLLPKRGWSSVAWQNDAILFTSAFLFDVSTGNLFWWWTTTTHTFPLFPDNVFISEYSTPFLLLDETDHHQNSSDFCSCAVHSISTNISLNMLNKPPLPDLRGLRFIIVLVVVICWTLGSNQLRLRQTSTKTSVISSTIHNDFPDLLSDLGFFRQHGVVRPFFSFSVPGDDEHTISLFSQAVHLETPYSQVRVSDSVLRIDTRHHARLRYCVRKTLLLFVSRASKQLLLPSERKAALWQFDQVRGAVPAVLSFSGR